MRHFSRGERATVIMQRETGDRLLTLTGHGMDEASNPDEYHPKKITQVLEKFSIRFCSLLWARGWANETFEEHKILTKDKVSLTTKSKNESPLFLKASTQKNKMDGCHHLISGCVAHPLGSVGACFQMTSSATQTTAQLVTLGSGDHACHIFTTIHLLTTFN